MVVGMNALALRNVPLLAKLSDAELEALADALVSTHVERGAVLFSEGEIGEHFYVVLNGAIAIIKSLGTPDERLISVRGIGDFVGEMSLLNGDGRRTASVRVESDAEVLVLTRKDFDMLLHRHPDTAYEMLQVMSARLRESHNATIRDLHEKNNRLARAYEELQAAQAQIIEQETLLRELQLASDIQQNMLPRTLPEPPGFAIAACMIPARMVGGDFYDVFPLDDHRFGIVVGDACGKGIPAALYMALTSSLLRAEATRGASPEATLRMLNRHLFSRNEQGMFVTVIYGVLDCATNEFSYVRAGHEYPLLWDANGAPLPLPKSSGHPIGLFPDPLLDCQSIVLPPGSAVLLYSDGVPDAQNAARELFGHERLTTAALADPDVTAGQLCDRLCARVMAYQGEAPQADDITLLTIRRL